METMSTTSSLRQLLYEDVSRMISAEMLLKSSVLGWINKGNSASLKMLMLGYQDVVEKHIRQLGAFRREEQITACIPSNGVMSAFIADADDRLFACTRPEVRDVCLLSAIQSINHFKISVYGTMAAFAGAVRLEKAGLMFHQAELDEKEIDERLSYLAEHELNRKAMSPAAATE
ncbi:DUF892 family protein [Mucilaginibacter rubeus]|uniref:DUF892 family protein n=1 Tax=Mucilaginibacter rubeus TaxID=2027860 RepID=A0AAE6JLD0_9SPHI|nr:MULTISPECIES: DUF892 family protein [Mucilaginibacter]QEM07660.1 DUF892 family protein [Mucilaginibacter rubeus]QEM20115.1 DUF892 family protein [Mucilaginibacter gossypii]QTE43174.1 DUF892 family protein [Mucilaginibacter rubeus]QTE49774.1 DUF892 family protein [Mucilaginibacter rubeus]QTE54868.1 DUF892 family protein [Mucilaginibacter rubeus]